MREEIEGDGFCVGEKGGKPKHAGLMNRIRFFTMVMGLFIASSCGEENGLVKEIISQYSPSFRPIIDSLDRYQVQVYYTQINRDEDNNPYFASYPLHVDENRYFYPASTVKLPVALLALEYINELNINGLDMNTPMFTDAVYEWQSEQHTDDSSESGQPSVAHYVKKIFLVSDNDAYNRLYELLGPNYINERLAAKGYKSARVIHRLEQTLTAEQNLQTNPVRFMKGDQVVFEKKATTGLNDFDGEEQLLLGKGEMVGGTLIKHPKDFSTKNALAIKDLQQILRAIIFPESVPPFQRFNLTEEQLLFVRKWMSALPKESDYPTYDTQQYFDSYVKFFLFGDSQEMMPKQIRIFNKVGDAYGFLIDNAYIVDFKNGVEFFLTACIYTNDNGIFNDNVYEYEEVGYPFMAELGRAIYQYELHRQREVSPNLSVFTHDYEQ